MTLQVELAAAATSVFPNVVPSLRSHQLKEDRSFSLYLSPSHSESTFPGGLIVLNSLLPLCPDNMNDRQRSLFSSVIPCVYFGRLLSAYVILVVIVCRPENDFSEKISRGNYDVEILPCIIRCALWQFFLSSYRISKMRINYKTIYIKVLFYHA